MEIRRFLPLRSLPPLTACLAARVAFYSESKEMELRVYGIRIRLRPGYISPGPLGPPRGATRAVLFGFCLEALVCIIIPCSRVS